VKHLFSANARLEQADLEGGFPGKKHEKTHGKNRGKKVKSIEFEMITPQKKTEDLPPQCSSYFDILKSPGICRASFEKGTERKHMKHTST